MQENIYEDSDSEEEILVARWHMRQAELTGLLEASGAMSGERRMDWTNGHIEWVDQKGQRLAFAKMKALCSYSFAEQSLMMAWANVEFSHQAVIDALPDLPSYIESCEEEDAWLWAMYLAEESKAKYLYRLLSPNYLVFLGLWNFRTFRSQKSRKEEEIEIGSPHAFVLELIDDLQAALHERANDSAYLRQYFMNQGQSLIQNAIYLESDGANIELLRHTSEVLIELGQSFGQRRFGFLPAPPLSQETLDQISSEVAQLRLSWVQSARAYKPPDII